MKYDDISWHAEDVEVKGLLYEAGGTHISFYFAWLVINNLVNEDFINDFSEEIEKLKDREITPGDFFLQNLDGKFSDQDLNDVGVRFSNDYYNLEKGCPYLRDYELILGNEVDNLYAVENNWKNYEKIATVISKKFANWNNGSLGFFKKLFG